MRRPVDLVTLALCLSLAACGGGEPAATNQSATPAAPASAASWNALDACATLGADKAAAVTGAKVTASEIVTRVEAAPGTAAFSMCTFTFASGAKLHLLTREAPDADAIQQAIELARTSGGTMPPAADVPGLGKAALWSDAMHGLQLFLDDKRYASINYSGLPAGTDRAKSIEIARALL